MAPPLGRGSAPTVSPSDAAQTAYDKAALNTGKGIASALQTPTAAMAGNGMPVWGDIPSPTLNDGSVNPASTIVRATTGAPKITLKVSDGTDTGTAPDPFAAAKDITKSMPPAITGWMGETQSRSNTKTTDMVTVYTNIEAATPKKLEAKSTDVTNLGLQTNQAVLDDGKKTSYARDDTFTGTFRGHKGTFTCTGDACAVGFVTNPGDGVNPNTVATLTNWSFKSDAYIESLAVQDEDYLYFGYWLQSPATGTKHAFNTFFGGNAPFDPTVTASQDADGNAITITATTANTTFTAVESKAVYNGSAAGKYVEKTLAVVGGEAKPVAIAGDYFTADAQLTAYFGVTPNVAQNMHNTIRGTISNFKNSKGDDVNFTINLQAINFGRTANLDADPPVNGRGTDVGSFVGGKIVGFHGTGSNITQATGGKWEGRFFGPLPTKAEETGKPTGVAGDFEANFNDGDVVGAFGATR